MSTSWTHRFVLRYAGSSHEFAPPTRTEREARRHPRDLAEDELAARPRRPARPDRARSHQPSGLRPRQHLPAGPRAQRALVQGGARVSDEILRFDARRGIAGNTALTGNTINVRDAYSDPRFYTGIDDQTGYRTRNLLAVAVRNQQGEIIGAFEALNKRSGVFSARDEESLARAGLARRGAPSRPRNSSANCGAIRTSWRSRTRTCGAKWKVGTATHGIIGSGQRIQQIVRLVERIRDSVVNVLITGESGTGKELVAKAIHYNSPARAQAFRGTELRGAARDAAGKRALRHREGRGHGRGPARWASSKRPTAARFSWTRSATSASPRRPRFCACCRSACWNGWAGAFDSGGRAHAGGHQ